MQKLKDTSFSSLRANSHVIFIFRRIFLFQICSSAVYLNYFHIKLNIARCLIYILFFIYFSLIASEYIIFTCSFLFYDALNPGVVHFPSVAFHAPRFTNN